MNNEILDKFFFLQNIEQYILSKGIGIGLADLITFIIACSCLLITVWLLDVIGAKILLTIVRIFVKRTKTLWDDYLLKRKFFKHIIKIITATILLIFTKVIFIGFHTKIITGTEMAIKVYILVVSVLLLSSFLDAVNDIYEAHPAAKRKSIKGYLQTGKIMAWVIDAILIIAMLFQKDPTQMLVGLGASAAIITLVFKDTILGFIASIQISAQDMIRPGDWIEVPAKNADGVVEDINVNNVKVRNWNNTVTMVPIYSLVSDSFTNWRNMEESSGRRIKRPLLIDITSIRAITNEISDEILSQKCVSMQAELAKKILSASNSNCTITNLGLYRCYIEAYMKTHPKIAKNEMTMVRYLMPDENGISLELYAFSTEKGFVEYERVVADLFEHIIAMAPIFGIKLYQRPAVQA